MSRTILEESYAADQGNVEIFQLFIDRLAEFYGFLTITDRQELKDLKGVDAAEIVHFSNGSQFRVALKRIDDQEVVCRAVHEFNYDYMERLTDDDISFLRDLAKQRLLKLTHIPGVNQPLDPYEQIEEEKLSYLVPKLMIITGQAKEENFGTDDERE